jgi:4-hydroxybenzoate polyprenyltransferase
MMLNGFLRLIRVKNLLMVVLTQYLVYIFLVGPRAEWLSHVTDGEFFIVSLSTVLIAAAGYIINDYYDIKIDTINRPGRVVVGRLMRRRMAMTSHLVLNALGIFLGLLIDWRIGAINLFSAFLLWLYSNHLKRLPFVGNLTIALLTAFTLLVVVVYAPGNLTEVAAFAAFAFFISLIREIIKDMEDVKGDATFGCQTLPIIWGIRRTKWLLYGLIALFVIVLFTLSAYLENHTLLYIYGLMMVLVGWLTYNLAKADTKREFAYLSRYCKIIMLAGVVSMVLV